MSIFPLLVKARLFKCYFFLEIKAEDEMVLYREAGMCTNGYYAGEDGLTDLQSCFEQCLGEIECMYVSVLAGKTCSRFKNQDCKISLLDDTRDAMLYITYQKVSKGAFITLFRSTWDMNIYKRYHRSRLAVVKSCTFWDNSTHHFGTLHPVILKRHVWASIEG